MSARVNVELSRTDSQVSLGESPTPISVRMPAEPVFGFQLTPDHGSIMPAPKLSRRPAPPMEGLTTICLPSHPDRPARMFLPSDYQPKYAYPLVVLFHASGSDEDTASSFAPLLSRRNYIAVCPRGAVSLGTDSTGRPGFAWDGDSADSYLAKLLAHASEQYHIHLRRIYLVGLGDGVTAACRFAASLRRSVAGVVALNGLLPELRRKQTHGLRMFVGHGSSNPLVPVSAARRTTRQLAACGADVRFQAYPSAQRITQDMLRDVNRWIMETVNTDKQQSLLG